jgi:hypothetical protein
MRRFLLSLLVMLSVATVPRSTIAQSTPRGGPLPLSFLDIVPAEFVSAAFAQPYGRALVTEFAVILGDSANPECLKAKGITKEKLSDSARTILPQRGTFLLKRLIGTIDQATFKTYAPARIGRDGLAEIKRLEDNPNVRTYLDIEKPALLAYVASYIAENVDRYALLNRIKLARGVNPYSSDNQLLIDLDPTQKTEAKLKEMVANDKSGVLERYLGFTAAAQRALNDAIDTMLARSYGPGELLADPNKNREGLSNDLAGLCVARRTPQ